MLVALLVQHFDQRFRDSLFWLKLPALDGCFPQLVHVGASKIYPSEPFRLAFECQLLWSAETSAGWAVQKKDPAKMTTWLEHKKGGGWFRWCSFSIGWFFVQFQPWIFRGVMSMIHDQLGWFFVLNDEQTTEKVRVEYQPVRINQWSCGILWLINQWF